MPVALPSLRELGYAVVGVVGAIAAAVVLSMLFTSLGLLPSSVIGETAATDPAYLLGLAAISIVVATRGVMIWHQESGPRWKESFDRVRSPRDWSLTRREWALLTGGYLLLAVANYREALAIARVAG